MENNEKPTVDENAETMVNPELNVEAESKTIENPTDNKLAEAEAKVKLLEGQLQTQKDQLLRTFAEFENYKRRNESEKSGLIKYGGESVLKDLLTVIDDFERSISAAETTSDPETIKTGIKLIFSNLTKMVESKGVQKIECIGKKFDVNEHEALMHIEKEETEPDIVVEEVQKGYTYNGKVIRHAKVLVSK